MNQNLGRLDRIFRFALGIWIISLVLPVITNNALWWALLAVAVIGLLESFFGWCGLHSICGINLKNQ